MNDEIKINKSNKSITFINDGIAFSQFGIADEILNLIANLQQDNTMYAQLKDEYEEEIKDLQQENEKLNKQLNQADNKNLELIEILNKIYDVIENKNITGIEARLKIQAILEKQR